jgi:hypothetical protein
MGQQDFVKSGGSDIIAAGIPERAGRSPVVKLSASGLQLIARAGGETSQ